MGHIDIEGSGQRLRATCNKHYWYAHKAPDTTAWPFVAKWGKWLQEAEARREFPELSGLHYQSWEEDVRRMAEYYAVGGPGVPKIDIGPNGPLPELLVKAGLAKSKSAARRLIQQGGVRVNEIATRDVNRVIGPGDSVVGAMLLRVGKYRCVRLGLTG